MMRTLKNVNQPRDCRVKCTVEAKAVSRSCSFAMKKSSEILEQLMGLKEDKQCNKFMTR